jgi:D-arabinose 1-dehydrogenase-like Zn-dependent alcohol dehydrogenase
MLCGGVTTWSPLGNNGAGPGKKVGIVGIGGLGHLACSGRRHWAVTRS